MRKPSARQTVWPLVLIAAILGLCALAALAQPSAASALPPAVANNSRVTLTVFAAASLTDAFREIGQKFELYNPGIKVVFNFAGSQVLAQQINQGAAADVFASANAAQMNVAIQGGRVSASDIFARNRLVVVCPAADPGRVKTWQDLARPGLQIVLAAKSVPAGQYALDLLDKAGADPAFGGSFKAAVLENVVSYEDNVKAVFAKVALGEADAGVVYATDVAGADAAKVKRLHIPDNLNSVAAYPIAMVNDSSNLYWARGFVRLVLSQEGQLVLSKYGFIPTGTAARPSR